MPNKPPNLSPTPTQTKAPKKATTIITPEKWAALRRSFINGDDDVTFKRLVHDNPEISYSAITSRSSREKWPELRQKFRDQTANAVNAPPRSVTTFDLETVEEVKKRHITGAKAMQALALKRIQAILTTPALLQEISAAEATNIYRIGTEIERKSRGMEEFTVRVEDLRGLADLKSLSNEQLLELLERRRTAGGAKA